MKRMVSFAAAALLCSVTAASSAGSPFVGWVTICDAPGKIYRCKTGGTPESLFTIPNAGKNTAWQSVWSADGKYIYFQGRVSGGIWVMDNDGKNAKKLCDAGLPLAGNGTYVQKLDAYRPDPDYAFYVDGSKFYKISRLTGEMTLFHTDTRTYWGESQISTDGKRMVARTSNELYKITVGGTSSLISSICASSISPDGKYITHDQSGTKTEIILWDDLSVYKTILPSSGTNFDNTKFAVNSNDFVAYYLESSSVSTAGVFQISTGTHFKIGNIKAENPSLWVGDLPPPPTSAGPAEHATFDNSAFYMRVLNPAHPELCISLPAFAGKALVTVVTASGKTVGRAETVSGKELRMGLDKNVGGVCVVNVSAGGATYSKKVMMLR
jgi:hypothetical protein